MPGEGASGPQRADFNAGFILPAVLVFFFSVLILLLRHEMWQDEWQAWLIVRESASLRDLFRNLRYDGHPALWHLGLFLVQSISPNPLGMQLFHLLLATSSVYVFLQYSPFTRLQKLLFLGGYFPFYEYAVISRNYALGVLGLFSFCAVFCRPRPRNYPLLGVILFLLCQTSVYGLMLALVLGVILIWSAFREGSAGTGKVVAASALVLLGMALSLVQMIPPPDSNVAVGWNFTLDFPHLVETLAAVWKSFVPIPAPGYHFWESNLISDPRWQALLSLIILAFCLLLFSRQPLALFLFTVGAAGILTFSYSKYAGSIRHHGHLYLLFIAGLWLSSPAPGKISAPSLFRTLAEFCRVHRQRVVTVIFAAHLLAGFWAASLDFLFPFSASKDVAGFIKEQQLDRMLLVGYTDDAASSVSGYLNRRIYYPSRRAWGSFIIQNRDRKTDLTIGEVIAQAEELSRRHRQKVLLLLDTELPPGRFAVTPVKKFTNSLVPAENYYLYLLPAPAP